MDNILNCTSSYKKDSHYVSSIFDNDNGKMMGLLYDKDIEKIKFYSRLISSLPRFFNELYAYRMNIYSKTFIKIINENKSVDLAEKMAVESVKEFDEIINYIVTGKN